MRQAIAKYWLITECLTCLIHCCSIQLISCRDYNLLFPCTQSFWDCSGLPTCVTPHCSAAFSSLRKLSANSSRLRGTRRRPAWNGSQFDCIISVTCGQASLHTPFLYRLTKMTTLSCLWSSHGVTLMCKSSWRNELNPEVMPHHFVLRAKRTWAEWKQWHLEEC